MVFSFPWWKVNGVHGSEIETGLYKFFTASNFNLHLKFGTSTDIVSYLCKFETK